MNDQKNRPNFPSPQNREDPKPNRPLASSERPSSSRNMRSPHLPVGNASPEPRNPKRRSQSTQNSGGNITPSNSSPAPGKTRHAVRRSFSSDQYGGFGQHSNHPPTIPPSDASPALSAHPSVRRKSTLTLRSALYDKDSPPKNRSGSTQSKHQGYFTNRPPQSQSLNAAMELLSPPPGSVTPTSTRGNGVVKPESPGRSYDGSSRSGLLTKPLQERISLLLT